MARTPRRCSLWFTICAVPTRSTRVFRALKAAPIWLPDSGSITSKADAPSLRRSEVASGCGRVSARDISPTPANGAGCLSNCNQNDPPRGSLPEPQMACVDDEPQFVRDTKHNQRQQHGSNQPDCRAKHDRQTIPLDQTQSDQHQAESRKIVPKRY